MKKVAVFVEGQAELIFVREMLLRMYNYQHIGINCYSLVSNDLINAPYEFGSTGEPNYYMIINVGNDNSVLSKILSRADGLSKKGYDKIIGLRDVYGDVYRKHNKGQRSINQNIISKMRDVAQEQINNTDYSNYIKLFFAIMEVEAWFLGFGKFEGVDASLSTDFIKTNLKYDLDNCDPETTYYHPARVIGDIYNLAGAKYDKHNSDVSSLVSNLTEEDYHNLMNSSKCSSFALFAQELLSGKTTSLT